MQRIFDLVGGVLQGSQTLFCRTHFTASDDNNTGFATDCHFVSRGIDGRLAPKGVSYGSFRLASDLNAFIVIYSQDWLFNLAGFTYFGTDGSADFRATLD